MRPTIWFGLLAAAAFGSCAQPTLQQQAIDGAATALGGRDRVAAVKTLVLEGEGTNGNLGQDMTPEATSQVFRVSSYKRALDLTARRVRIEQTRTPSFLYFQGQAPQKQVLGLDGAVGYNVAANGTATRVPDETVRDRRLEFYHHPLTIVRAALDPSAVLGQFRSVRGERVVDITTPEGLKLTLAIDEGTKLPTRVVSMTDNTNLGDVAVETTFADYEDVSGLKLPRHLTTKTDKYPTAELRLTKQTVDGDVGDLAAPAQAASAPATSGPAAANVTVAEVAKGVWFLAGQSHHSVVVEFGDHLTLIEAPQNDVRSLAVIEKAHGLVSAKPLTTVVNTHHHFDHSGGIRAAVSQGLTVITHLRNAAFYRDAIRRSHTIVPDALAKNVKPLKLQVVDQEATLEDKTRTVVLYSIDGSPHADTLLMAYLPKERLLVEADVFTPGAAVHPFAANLLENIKRRNLRIDRIVPIHGAVAPFADLVKAAAQTGQ